jgi:hypothetical protein
MPDTLVLSRSWEHAGSELAFVTRSLAGAASRCGQVTVLVPGDAGSRKPDGAFDLLGTGLGADGGWPDPAEVARPGDLSATPTVIIDQGDPGTLALIDALSPGRPVYSVAAGPTGADVRPLPLSGAASEVVGVHVPVNPLAANHRHNGLGFTGYLLVLTDRPGTPDVQPPTDLAAWLTARFPQADVVVVENGSAAVWRGRALRGVVGVDTRTDLWRLLAHALVTIDLAPGGIIARECIESLRFGTPIIVPATSAARPHVDAGGGLSYRDYAELLSCVESLLQDDTRAGYASAGRAYAEAQYGDAETFVARVAKILAARKPRRKSTP